MTGQGGDAPGRAAHAAWKAWQIEAGYPDHVYREGSTMPQYDSFCQVCAGRESTHHADMVDYDDLSPEKRQKYQAMALAGHNAWQREVDQLLGKVRETTEVRLSDEQIRMAKDRATQTAYVVNQGVNVAEFTMKDVLSGLTTVNYSVAKLVRLMAAELQDRRASATESAGR